jgi:hypothetical protein
MLSAVFGTREAGTVHCCGCDSGCSFITAIANTVNEGPATLELRFRWEERKLVNE